MSRSARRPQRLARRAWSWAWRAALFALLIAGSTELLLQAASLFVRGRGPEAVPEARVRILCVGDSHMYGAGVPLDQSFPAHLQRQLEERAPGRYSVINLGVPGMNTSQLRERLALQISRYRPDLVIAWAGVNNAWNAAARDLSDASWLELLEATAMRSRLYRLIRVQIHDRALERATVLASDDGVRQEAAGEACQGEECGDLRTTWRLGKNGAGEVIEHRRDLVDQDVAAQSETVYRDYAAMHAWLGRAGIPLLLIRYPVRLGASGMANDGIDRTAAAHGVTVHDALRSISRLTGEDREYRWANHPNGAMYAEIARDLIALVEANAVDRGLVGSSRQP
jgi:hypothetical protein